jgi:hypothetical protein
MCIRCNKKKRRINKCDNSAKIEQAQQAAFVVAFQLLNDTRFLPMVATIHGD